MTAQKLKQRRQKKWYSKKVDLNGKDKVLKHLGSSIWKDKDAERLYRRKYAENPAGEAHIWLALDEKNGRVASSYVAMPWKIWIDGKRSVAMQAVDVFTSFRYRGLKIYETQDREAPEYFRKDKEVSCFFAFPNPQAVKGHLNAGWKVIGRIERWVKVLRSEDYLAKVLKSPGLARAAGRALDKALKLTSKESKDPGPDYSVETVQRCNDEITELFEAAKEGHAICPVRDKDYLNWKYADCLDHNKYFLLLRKEGKLCGYAVLENNDDYGAVVDIFCRNDRPTLEALINGICRYFREKNAKAVSFTVLQDNSFLDEMKKFGFRKRPFERFLMGTVIDPAVNEKAFFNPASWHVTLGDCDIESVL